MFFPPVELCSRGEVFNGNKPNEQTVCSDEGLTLETSAIHHIPQATNIPYQPC